MNNESFWKAQYDTCLLLLLCCLTVLVFFCVYGDVLLLGSYQFLKKMSDVIKWINFIKVEMEGWLERNPWMLKKKKTFLVFFTWIRNEDH